MTDQLWLHSWEVAEIRKAIMRILKTRGGVAPRDRAIEIRHLSALFAVEWPYDFDRAYPGYREHVFQATVLQELGFEVDENGRVSIAVPRP